MFIFFSSHFLYCVLLHQILNIVILLLWIIEFAWSIFLIFYFQPIYVTEFEMSLLSNTKLPSLLLVIHSHHLFLCVFVCLYFFIFWTMTKRNLKSLYSLRNDVLSKWMPNIHINSEIACFYKESLLIHLRLFVVFL